MLGAGAGDPAIRQGLASYGRHLGIAFQLVDDVLDYVGDADELGKNVGDDLAEGKPTLPLIHAMREGSAAQAALIRDAIRHGGLEHLQDIVDIVQQSGGLEYTMEKAREQTRLAHEALAPVAASGYRDSLEQLARDAVDRHF